MPAPVQLTKADMLRLFDLLDAELAADETQGELYLVGGAVMCLAFDARPSTRDVDGWFKPAKLVREAAARVASRAKLPTDWLNDGVKGFLGTRGSFDAYFERDNLKVFVAQPSYLLALKCVAMRIGEEFHDLDDVRYLLRYLNVTRAADALKIVSQYFDESQIPAKTRLALEELLGG